jgi:hypothetical protein
MKNALRTAIEPQTHENALKTAIETANVICFLDFTDGVYQECSKLYSLHTYMLALRLIHCASV